LFTGLELISTRSAGYELLKTQMVQRLLPILPIALLMGATVQKPRRTQLQIVGLLLDIASRGGVTKTTLVYRGNLNFKIVQKYIDHLESEGMLARSNTNLGTFYSSTQKGLEALSSIRRALNYMPEKDTFPPQSIELWP